MRININAKSRPDVDHARVTGAFFYNARTQMFCHVVRVVIVQVQLLGNLLAGQAHSHEIQADYPD